MTPWFREGYCESSLCEPCLVFLPSSLWGKNSLTLTSVQDKSQTTFSNKNWENCNSHLYWPRCLYFETVLTHTTHRLRLLKDVNLNYLNFRDYVPSLIRVRSPPYPINDLLWSRACRNYRLFSVSSGLGHLCKGLEIKNPSVVKESFLVDPMIWPLWNVNNFDTLNIKLTNRLTYL